MNERIWVWWQQGNQFYWFDVLKTDFDTSSPYTGWSGTPWVYQDRN